MPFYEYRKLSPEEQRALVAERLARGYPPHRPPHPEQGPGYYLLTAPCYEYRAVMVPESRRIAFQQRMLDLFNQPGIIVCVWVVLPNHYHVLACLPALAVVPPIFNLLHGGTSRLWNLEDDKVGRKAWYQYSDRRIRDEDHFYRAINYLHNNPVRHGYARDAREWPSSSLSRYIDEVGTEWLERLWRASGWRYR
jgi:putative transposase